MQQTMNPIVNFNNRNYKWKGLLYPYVKA